MSTWKVGELGRRTGLTVRTLHHYDRIGLLSPSGRSAAGYRLYDDADVARLHRIVVLRQLGLSLEQVRESLAGSAWTLERVLRAQLERLRERMAAERALYERVERLAARVAEAGTGAAGAAEGVSADELLETIEAMTMFEKYYTPEQLAQLDARGKELGAEHIRAVEAEWPRLIAAAKDCMARGVEPTAEEVRPLAQRCRELIREFTGGDAGIARSVSRVYQGEPSVRERTGLDPAVMEYIGRAVAAVGGW
jgi:DNA-binding transcriptional MerR regulator